MTMTLRPIFHRCISAAAAAALFAAPLSAGGAGEPGAAPDKPSELTLYSGRGEALVAPLLDRFEEETGIRIRARYGGTAELAVLLSEEGTRSPADLFWGQDAGALGALSGAGLLYELPETLTAGVPDIYRSATRRWIATSGRARVLAYSPQRVGSDEFPSRVFDLTAPRYRGRVGWAPTNGSFQAFVTAMRIAHGDRKAGDWVAAMRDNEAQAYRNNTALVEAIAAGEIDFALTNNYYLLRFKADDPDYPVAQRFFDDGDVGNLVNVAGLAILGTGARAREALRFAEFLLSPETQEYFTDVVYEYPVRADVEPSPRLESFQRLIDATPRLSLDALEDLEGTLELLRREGLL